MDRFPIVVGFRDREMVIVLVQLELQNIISFHASVSLSVRSRTNFRCFHPFRSIIVGLRVV